MAWPALARLSSLLRRSLFGGRAVVPVSKSIPAEVIVKFKEGASRSLDTTPDGELVAEGFSLDRFHAIRGSAQARQSFPRFSRRLRLLKTNRARRSGSGLSANASLDLFVRVRPTTVADANPLAVGFATDSEVEFAGVAMPHGRPSPGTDVEGDLSGGQDYLETFGAVCCWYVAGDHGAGRGVVVGVCDDNVDVGTSDAIEGVEEHFDLQGQVEVLTRPGGVTSFHGTSVLGILAANKHVPEKGIVGVCHEADFKFWSGSTDELITGAIDAALGILDDGSGSEPEPAVLGPGDVLLLEVEGSYGVNPADPDQITPKLPIEVYPDVRTAIRNAVDLGVTVIEPAGNANLDLGSLVVDGDQIWDHIREETEADDDGNDDTGAIFVGAGTKTNLTRTEDSNFGDRVDCQASGEGVLTTAHKANTRGFRYDWNFNGTSSAGALIAGVVTCVQGAYREILGNDPQAPFLQPRQIRSLLRDSANGLASGSMDKRIGPRPHLRKLLKAVGIQPQILIRDAVGDSGNPVSPETFTCWSPDILLTNEPVDLGQLRNLAWDNASFGDRYAPDSVKYVYVRLENVGNARDDVGLTLYWAPFSCYQHPRYWRVIGRLDVVDAAPGQHRVAGPLTWLTPKRESSVCLIAVQNTRCIPHPALDRMVGTREFLRYRKQHGAISYRNVGGGEVSVLDGSHEFKFTLNGLTDQASRCRFELHGALPHNSSISITARTRTGDPIAVAFPIDDRPWDSRLPISWNWQGPVTFDGLLLPRNAQLDVEVSVRFLRPESAVLHVDQFWDDTGDLGVIHLGRANLVATSVVR